jgi:putative ABC transport system substrate-binding protein
LPLQNAWLQALRDHGWIEGKNLIVDHTYFGSDEGRIAALAAELVARKPDLLMAAAPAELLALKSATTIIPILFVSVADPVGLGVVQSLSHPGGNITGLATFVPGDFVGKGLGILRELVPVASTIAMLINPTNPIHRMIIAEELPRTAEKSSMALPIVEASNAEELDMAFASAAAQHADAIDVFGDPLTIQQAPRVIALAAKHRLPAIYLFRLFAAAGGLLSYGPDLPDLWRRAGGYADKILRGTKPSDLPVEQPTKFEMVINMKTARELGLVVPPSLLARVDEVIE